MVSCSSPKQVAPLDENLVFNEDQVDLIEGLDFSDSEGEEEDSEFAAIDGNEKKPSKKTNDEDDFDLFDEGEDTVADLDTQADEDDFGLFDDSGDDSETDTDFDLFDDSESTNVVDSSDDGGDTGFDLFDENEKSDQTDEIIPPITAEDTDTDGFDVDIDADGGFDSPLDTNLGNVSSSSDSGFDEESTVLSIDYNSFQEGGSFVVRTAGNPKYETEFIPETNQYVLKLNNAKIAKQLLRPFLTKDFRQSFEAMNSYKGQDGSVKFVFQLKNNSYPRVVRSGEGIVIQPGIGSKVAANQLNNRVEDKVSLSATSFEDFLLDKSKYVGKPVSIHVKNEDVVTIIQFISEQVGANIVISDTVKGPLSIKLKNVPWDQALVAIMKAKGLGYVRDGNILRVSTLDDLKKESLAAAEVQKTRKTLAPFHVKVFPLSYASPPAIETKVKAFLTKAAGPAGRAGQVLSEERSSSLIVRDTLEVIKNISALIKELDRAPLQVMIQAKIVEANKNFTKTLAASLESTSNIPSAGGQPRGRSLLDWSAQRSSGADGSFFVPQISLGGLNFLGTLTASLRLQEMDSNAKILSSPSVLAINNEKARILQSDQVLNATLISDQAGNSTQTVERNNVELSLDVTPQVSADSNIIMDIEVKRQFPQPVANGPAPISSREAKTKVIIGNNRTAMIGGVYQVSEQESVTGTPYLRKIPLLKWLFQNKTNQKSDTELVIFITPRVVSPNSLGGKQLANKKLLPSGNAVTSLGAKPKTL
jgi:type IV pilus assembly protein PilQ